jgi:RNA polymerase sigma-70 factor (ECF subfamily)
MISPNSAIGYQSPIDALKSWYAQHPDLFVKQVYKQAELDTYHSWEAAHDLLRRFTRYADAKQRPMFRRKLARRLPDTFRRARKLAKGNIWQAEEWLSDAALKSLEILRRIPERIHNPQGFLFLALQHAYLDGIRKATREKRMIDHDASPEQSEEPAATQTPFEVFAGKEHLERLCRSLSRLDPAWQRLFVLAFIEECPYPEIAARLEISVALARKRIQRLRGELRRLTKSSQP